MEGHKSNHVEEEDISVKELILHLQAFCKEVLQNWLLVLIIAGAFAGILLAKAFWTAPVYDAKLTFMINEDEGSSFGGIAAVLGQFGLGGGKKGKHNLDKLLELTRSRKIMQDVLFHRETIHIKGETKEDYIANHLIHLYDFHEKWEDDTTGLFNFVFKHDRIEGFSRAENKVLKVIHKKIIGGESVKGLFSTSSNEDTGIMTFSVKTESEKLSIALSGYIYDRLSLFYVEKTIEKQKQTYDVVHHKVDSVKNVLDRKEFQLANFKDTHLGLWTRKNKLKEQQLQRDVTVLNVMYGELLKNLEIADFTLKSKTPFVQLIDAPIAPIKANSESKLKAILLGGILGGFLAVMFILLRRVYREIMNSDVN